MARCRSRSTYLAYRAQKDRAEVEKDPTLAAIFFLVSRDEAAHAGFYRAMIEIEMAEDRVGTLADLALVIANFKMPGDGLIPNYHENLRIGGGGNHSARVPDPCSVSIAQAIGHHARSSSRAPAPQRFHCARLRSDPVIVSSGRIATPIPTRFAMNRNRILNWGCGPLVDLDRRQPRASFRPEASRSTRLRYRTAVSRPTSRSCPARSMPRRWPRSWTMSCTPASDGVPTISFCGARKSAPTITPIDSSASSWRCARRRASSRIT